MAKPQRSALGKFRCSVAPLQVVIGRYSNVPLNQWLCMYTM